MLGHARVKAIKLATQKYMHIDMQDDEIGGCYAHKEIDIICF